uniref:Serine/threonine-protein phosphatase 7 long form homolog n=1 Tax=Nicotiana tabacum TaxID=4097 RepID=A0A1S4CTE5_TOBAC|nr:PREDICTED: serine/threonine-protein phosphatase 7 long form homolog [Nicotiana tabacum]
MALIERWRPETHTFHLPIGETTITLQDTEILYGLSADGLPVLLTEDETAASGSSRMQLVPIIDHLEHIQHTITDELVEVDVQRYTRLLLLLLLEGVLFLNTSGNLVSLRFLHHISRFEDTAIYSWGCAIISYLYRQMCRACIGTQRDVGGFLPLLQFQPPLPILPANVEILHLPLAYMWVMRCTLAREYDAHHNLPLYRDVLDLLEDAQAIGLHTVYHMGLQMQSHIHAPVAMPEYSRRFMDVAAQTLQQARSDQRLAYEVDYMDPTQYK